MFLGMLVHELKLCACSDAAIWSKFSPVHTPLSKGLTAVAVFLAASPWPKGTMTKKNNKGKIAGSGTVSNARRERYKEACRERDRLLEQATTEEEKQKAKEAQKIKQRKPEEGARSSQVKVEELQHPWKKEQEVKAEQKQEAAPCQKEQKKDDAQPAAPCQKEQKKDDAQPSAPCQKEQKKDDAQPSAPGQKELGPSTKQEMLEHLNTKREILLAKRGSGGCSEAQRVKHLRHPRKAKGPSNLKHLVKMMLHQAAGPEHGSMMATGGSARKRSTKELPLTTT